ncbi:MAG: Hsp20/alpha crystallin family protein [Candidatus Kryptoniota bacterium]
MSKGLLYYGQNILHRLFPEAAEYGFPDDPVKGMLLEFVPKVDVYDSGTKIIVEADLPGVSPQDVRVKVVDSDLYIEGEREIEGNEKFVYSCCERPSGFFSRQLKLPDSADLTRVKTQFKNGVLRIEFGKKAVPLRNEIQIKIQ